MKSTLLILLMTFAFTAHNFAQKGSLSGRMLDDQQQPVAFANVLLLAAADSSLVKGAVTDEAGAFQFGGVPFDRYFLTGSMVGFADVYSEPFQLDRPIMEAPNLQLGAAGIELAAIEVKGEKPFIELQHEKVVVNVENSPVAAGSNALEILAKAPGVTVDQDDRITLKGKDGVLVMINGKNTYMSREEVVRLLQNTPADNIESIELISNPSSKYDAAGNAGIINIRMKRDKGLGTNGNLTVGGGQGRYPKANTSLRLNHREKSFNVYGDYSMYYNKRFQDLTIDRTIPNDQLLTRFYLENYQRQYSISHRASVGADFFVTPKTTVGILANTTFGEWNVDALNQTSISGDNPEPFSLVDATTLGVEEWDNYTFNANLRRQFSKPGQELTADFDYSRYGLVTDMDFANRFFVEEKSSEVQDPNLLRSDNASDVIIRAAKVDYTHPLNEKTKVETGWKSSWVNTENDLLFTVFQENEWQDDPLRSNAFDYEEQIHAGYLNLATQLKGINFQLGLRAEYTVSDGYSVTLDQRVERDYLNWFPSVSISHQVGEQHSLAYSFSRRIDRPSYQDLNPFVYFLDQYTYGKGNPFLRPQYTDAFGLSYNWQGKLMVGLNYSHTTEVMQEVIEQDEATLSTFQTRANLDDFRNYSVSVSVPVPVTKWWSARVNLVGFVNDFSSRDIQAGGDLDNDMASTNINISNNITLPGGFQAQLSGFYQSELVYGMFEISPHGQVDFGLSKSILDGKGSLKLNVNDIFFTNNNVILIRQGRINANVTNFRDTRRANLTFSYRFGNDQVKPARNRRTATDSEQQRVKQN